MASADGDAVVRRYEWVEFTLSLHQRLEMSAARAAALSWFALSSCPGYSGRENPEFWKCVFSQLWTRINNKTSPKLAHEPDHQSITDAVEFFTGDGAEFPRFRVQGDYLFPEACESNLRLFCGDSDTTMEHEDSSRLSQVVACLGSYIDQKRASRPLCLSIARVSSFSLTVPDKRYPKRVLGPVLHKLLTDMNQIPAPQPVSPWNERRFVIKEISFYDELHIDCYADATLIETLVQDFELSVDAFESRFHESVSRDKQASIVRAILRRGTTSTISFTSSKTAQFLPAIASALPFATAVDRIQVSLSDRIDEFDNHDIVWLAYAMFHPDASSSSWKHLNLVSTTITDRTTEVLQGMAGGNNLHALLEGRQPTSDGYYRATLLPKACVYAQPPQHWLHQWLLTPLETSDGNLTVDVCGVTTVDPTQWTEWVPVVVPAYGLGWIRSADVIHVTKRPSATSSIEGLYLARLDTYYRDDPEMVVALLAVIGASIRHLNVERYCSWLSSSVLQQALACCPALESLAIVHTGDVWRDKHAASLTPRLRALQLHISRDTIASNTLASFHVPGLQFLRVCARTWSNVFDDNVNAVRHILTHSRELQGFHWEEGLMMSRTRYHPTPYPETCATTSERLKILVAGVEAHRSTVMPVPTPSTLAFLSVLNQRASQESPGSARALDLEALTLILAFAGTLRSIVIEPSYDELPSSRRKLHRPI